MRNLLIPITMLLATASGITSAQPAALSVTLDSAAFDLPPAVGEVVRLEASASGGTPPYTYAWDLDGDGTIDRSSPAAAIEATFPRAGTLEVNVSVVDAFGASGSEARELYLRGPRLLIEPIGPINGPTDLHPGLRLLSQHVRATNVGDATQPAGHAMFVPASIETSTGPSNSGYLAISDDSGFCSFGWIDLVAGPHATPALSTSVADGNARGPLNDARTAALALPGGVRIHDERYTHAVMSTNGYLSLDPRDTGADFSPRCDNGFEPGSFGPQLRPFHDDLIIAASGDQPAGNAGLRYRHFDSCPRVADDRENYPCHVFSWISMQRWQTGEPSASFDFQTIAYVGREEIAFQYRNAPPDAGAAATIGITNRDGSEAYNASCATPSVNRDESATCFYRRDSSASRLRIGALVRELVPVPELAVGESASLLLGFGTARGARCGQPVRIDYLGTAWPGGQNVEPVRVLDTRIAEQCTPPAAGPIGIPPGGHQLAIPRRSGLYFNGSRPGNGLVAFFRNNGPLAGVDQTEEFAGGWYTALADRTPVWFTLQGELVEGTGELILRKFNNVAAPDGFEPVGEVVGRAWLGRIATDKVAFVWRLDDGSSGIETMQTSDFPLGGINHTQTWFDPAESGWGLAIESLYTGRPFEFFGAFVYDAGGAPRWVTGDIHGFAGGSVNLIGHRPHCPACPWIVDWNREASPAGGLQISYEESQVRASLDTAIVLPDAYNGEWPRSGLQIRPIAAPVPWP